MNFYAQLKPLLLKRAKRSPILKTHLKRWGESKARNNEIEGIPTVSRIDAEDQVYLVLERLINRDYLSYTPHEPLKLTAKGRAFLQSLEKPYQPTQGEIMNGQNIILVTFTGTSKEYAYFTDLDLEVGDYVVVAPIDGEFKVACVSKVTGLYESQAKRASKWIVQKVDTAAFYAREKRNELMQEIRNKLRQRKEQLDEIMLYQQLAGQDPEINSLLEQLAELDPTVSVVLPSGAEVKQVGDGNGDS